MVLASIYASGVSLNIALCFLFRLTRNVMWVTRYVWTLLGSMLYIIEIFQVWSTDTIWLVFFFFFKYIVRRVDLSAKKETPANFLTYDFKRISTFRPTDVLGFGQAGSKHACEALTLVFSHVGMWSGVSLWDCFKSCIMQSNLTIKNMHGKSTFVAFYVWYFLFPYVRCCSAPQIEFNVSSTIMLWLLYL